MQPSSRATRDLAERDRNNLGRAVIASCAGTTIDYYDILLYNAASALVFGRLFFPSHDPLLSTLSAFVAGIPGYLIRPIGALFFGHFGDRAGRKASLLATLVLMGVASMLIGIIPTYAQVGIWAPVMLISLRVLQGFGASGEWGGAVLMAAEWERSRHRGLAGAFAQIGISAGTALSQLVFLASILVLGKDSYWGWRVPFLFSVTLVFVGLYVRLGVLETPAFTNVLETRRKVRWPAAGVLRSLGKLVPASMSSIAVFAPAQLFTAFVLTYTVQHLGLSQPMIQGFVLIASVISIGTTLFWGYLSDVIGRKKLYAIGCLAVMLFAPIYWGALDSRMAGLVLAAIVASLVVRDMPAGPQPALLAETFPTPLRYTGTALSYNIGSALLSGTTTPIALALLRIFNTSLALVGFMVAVGIVALIGTLFLKDRTWEQIDESEQELPSRELTLP